MSITATANYSEPCVAVVFATARPGEPLTDFRHRLSVSNEYSRTRGLELVLDREAATALVKMLVLVVGTYPLVEKAMAMLDRQTGTTRSLLAR